jgi:hypothetical protein
MNSRHAVRSLISGALLAMAAMPSAIAQGSFDIPAGAHFNLQKLQRIGEFLRGEIAEGWRTMFLTVKVLIYGAMEN